MGVLENILILDFYLCAFIACGVIAAGVAWVAQKIGLVAWLRRQWWTAPFFLD